MNNTNYDFGNTGYKLHLPVLVDENNPLTQKILQYLDNAFGTGVKDRFGYKPGYDGGFYSKCYKLGNCSDATADGKGITIYGKVGNREEIEQLAKDIEKNFGTELNLNVKQNGIIHTQVDTMVTPNISGRFANYHFGTKSSQGIVDVFFDYNQSQNPSGANTIKIFTDHNGVKKETFLPDIQNMTFSEKAFLNGDSTLASIDNFGELFAGKLENGKLSKTIMDGFAPEYLAKYPNLVNELPTRLQKGTEKIVANMLEDVAKNGSKSTLFRQGAVPWFTTLEPSTIDNAKKLLASFEPQTVQKLESLLPQLVKNHPFLAVLNQTTPLSKMSGVNMSKVVGQIHQPQVVQAPITQTPKPVAHVVNKPIVPVAPEVHVANPTSAATKAVEKGMSKTTIGLIIAGATTLALGGYAFYKDGKNKEALRQQEAVMANNSQNQNLFGNSASIFNQQKPIQQQSFNGYYPQYACMPQMGMYQSPMMF